MSQIADEILFAVFGEQAATDSASFAEERAAIDRVLAAHDFTENLVLQHAKANEIISKSGLGKNYYTVVSAYVEQERYAGRWKE